LNEERRCEKVMRIAARSDSDMWKERAVDVDFSENEEVKPTVADVW